jgi:hypothetical protein
MPVRRWEHRLQAIATRALKEQRMQNTTHCPCPCMAERGFPPFPSNHSATRASFANWQRLSSVQPR